MSFNSFATARRWTNRFDRLNWRNAKGYTQYLNSNSRTLGNENTLADSVTRPFLPRTFRCFLFTTRRNQQLLVFTFLLSVWSSNKNLCFRLKMLDKHDMEWTGKFSNITDLDCFAKRFIGRIVDVIILVCFSFTLSASRVLDVTHCLVFVCETILACSVPFAGKY